MPLMHYLTNLKHKDPKVTLLSRFHVTVIFVNLFALIIDTSSERYFNAIIETFVLITLVFNLWRLRIHGHLKEAAYLFLLIISIALFTLIYHNHFATMSVVFVLLLPLTTLLFIRFKYSIFIEVALFAIMVLLLYVEYLNNPANPLVQNPQALFNLAYTAIIIYIFGLLYHFSIQKTFDELDSANRQNELLLKEVHHRVKNNLNVIASIIGLQANTLNGSEKEQLLKSKTRIESIAIVHEMLYKSDDFEGIEFDSYMRRLAELLLGMLSASRNIHIDIRTADVHVPLDLMIQLGIIANELLTNSIKYAFDNNKGNIQIELRYEDGHYLFLYSDDGKGAADTDQLSKGKTLGMKIIQIAARQLGGRLKLSSPSGLHYEIGFEHERD
ncbi:MAG: hypothetical protein DRG24_07215 [Epsilonproteobacteria bacterium]|nr:MAG: hypothetical protein DRG24_07215 [Campylobacterota bacterium]